MIEQLPRNTAFVKITAVYGQIDENGHAVRKWPARKIAITDKIGKNGRLSVKIQTFRPRFYGQMVQKAGFVRKMRFAYGQISKKWRFVRKIRVKSWCTAQNKKKSVP